VSELVAVVALWSHHGHWALCRDVSEFAAVEALSASARCSWWFSIWVFWLWAVSGLVSELTAVPAGLAGGTWFAALLHNGNVAAAAAAALVLWAVTLVVTSFTALVTGLSVSV